MEVAFLAAAVGVPQIQRQLALMPWLIFGITNVMEDGKCPSVGREINCLAINGQGIWLQATRDLQDEPWPRPPLPEAHAQAGEDGKKDAEPRGFQGRQEFAEAVHGRSKPLGDFIFFKTPWEIVIALVFLLEILQDIPDQVQFVTATFVHKAG